MQHTFDLIVIGAGPVGENAAGRAVAGGLSAAIVEAELIGGECSYWACMPSKALLRGTEVLAEARAVPGAAQAISGRQDVDATLARRTSFTSDWSDKGQEEWVRGAGITLFRGTGRLTGARRVSVTAADGSVTELTATHAVVLATGTTATIPPIEGIEDVRPWTSREATSATAAPDRLVVIGGGVVACEMATAWQALGSQVVMLVRGERLLAGLEPFAGELVAESLRAAGVNVRLGASVSAVRRDGDEVVVAADGDEVRGDEVLVATGRSPASGDLGLDTVGLEPGDFVEVDDTALAAGVDGEWLYAVGDVNGRNLLTHMGKYQARACADAILMRARGETPDPAAWSATSATADHDAATSVVFTELQVAAVGRTEEQARADGVAVKAVEYDLGAVAGSALFADSYQGRAKLVVDEDRRVVVGATFVGLGIGELLHSATIAVVGEVPLDRLWHAVPAYPTISEIWLRLLETYGL